MRYLTDLLSTPSPEGAAAAEPRSSEDAVFDEVKDKFHLIIFSCVRLASKLLLHSQVGSEMNVINTSHWYLE